MENIRTNPRVSLLVDHYEEEWEALWWVRADGVARVVEGGEEYQQALDRLYRKYPQYQEVSPFGPVILIEVLKWSGWSYNDSLSI